MPRILITGGSGILGSVLLPRLTSKGYTVRILSRSPRKPGYDAAVEWAQAQLGTGAGVAEALEDVDIVIHAASSAFKPQQADIQGTRNLLQHATSAGITHLIYTSIAGIERIPMGYYQAKLEAERMIERSDLPWTILRATQFHDLMVQLFLLPVIKLPFVAPVPKKFKFQPIDTGEVASRLVTIVEQGPAGRVEDIGGPEVLTLGAIARAWMQTTGKRRLLVNLPLPGAVARGFRQGYNTVPQHRFGTITWEEWLTRTYADTS